MITETVYELLTKETKLQKHIIPVTNNVSTRELFITKQVDIKDSEPSSFFFATDDALVNPTKLMILVHGSGVVRAGQWARRYVEVYKIGNIL